MVLYYILNGYNIIDESNHPHLFISGGGGVLSGRRGSNPRPSAWEADALPTELLPRGVGVAKLDIFFETANARKANSATQTQLSSDN